MSSIIKAQEATEIIPFSFREIDSRSNEEPPADSDPAGPDMPQAEAEPFEPEEPQVDPLEELEMIIQNRLMEAERRAQELESEAYEKGYAQGMHDGTEMGLKSMAITKESLDRLFAGLQELPRRVLADYRSWLISTSMAIARQIVGKELDTHPEILGYLVQSLLEDAVESQTLAVYLNPKDLEQLEEHTKLKSIVEKADRSLDFRQDSKIGRGGCRVESDLQLLDATIEKRFAMMEEALRRQGAEEEALARDGGFEAPLADAEAEGVEDPLARTVTDTAMEDGGIELAAEPLDEPPRMDEPAETAAPVEPEFEGDESMGAEDGTA